MTSPRRRPAGRLLLSGAVAVSLLLGAAQAGLAVPSEQVIRGIAASPALDDAGLEGSVAPLSDAFVAQMLGLDAPDATGTETAPTLAAGMPGARIGPQPVVTAQGPSHAAVTHEATNDDVADAYRVGSVPFSARTNGSNASRQTGEPEGCAPTGPTLWYRYDAPLPVGLSASTVGSSGVVALAVFMTDERDELLQVGCHVDVDGEAQVSFAGEAGVAYLFQVPRPAGGGPVGFNLDVLGTTTRISISISGEEQTAQRTGLDFYLRAGISGDGRYVVFDSAAHTLEGDPSPPFGSPFWGEKVFVHSLAGRV